MFADHDTNVGLLDKDGEYAEIKVTKSLGIEQIIANVIG